MGRSLSRWIGACFVSAGAALALAVETTTAIEPPLADGGQALEVRLSRQTGLATFVTAVGGGAISRPDAPGTRLVEPLEFLTVHGRLFGVDDPTTQLRDRGVVVDHLG